jgi:hypothetical protein
MNLLLDSPLFNLLYTNIKARASSSMPKPPSDPRRGPATHRLDIVIFYDKNFPNDFILGNERFLVNFVLDPSPSSQHQQEEWRRD